MLFFCSTYLPEDLHAIRPPALNNSTNTVISYLPIRSNYVFRLSFNIISSSLIALCSPNIVHQFMSNSQGHVLANILYELLGTVVPGHLGLYFLIELIRLVNNSSSHNSGVTHRHFTLGSLVHISLFS
jgi:hypothetical protein